ncbi:hypothetical protein PUN28_009143 [Cardiocondyla obscurior]|uniref:Uncharacterized protein n=1 Tax=Cardiocondyla obscurior TaxID=286306 RepID=A0AAW2FU64_9HYME
MKPRQRKKKKRKKKIVQNSVKRNYLSQIFNKINGLLIY